VLGRHHAVQVRNPLGQPAIGRLEEPLGRRRLDGAARPVDRLVADAAVALVQVHDRLETVASGPVQQHFVLAADRHDQLAGGVLLAGGSSRRVVVHHLRDGLPRVAVAAAAERELDVGDDDQVAVVQPDLVDPLPVQKRAVGALQVAEGEVRAVADDLGVLARDARREDLEIARLVAAERERKLCQLDPLRLLSGRLARQPRRRGRAG
jgi:hypothetical protein